MADGTKIEWADATVNAVNGCTRVSPGCGGPGPHGGCYAERLAGTRLRNHPSRAGLTKQTSAGPRWTGEVLLHEPALLQPLKWKRPRRIFWNAHGDLFHENVPDAWIDRVFAVCALTPQHQHQILTKRSARMREYLNADATVGRIADAIQPMRTDNRPVGPVPHVRGGETWWPLSNIWLGVSVEDQQRADERVPDLLATPAAVRFLSCEPLLGPVWPWHELILAKANRLVGQPANGLMPGLDWIIAGGESGPKARPMHPDWARSLRDRCAAVDVPFFFKQWGEWAPASTIGFGKAAGAEMGMAWPDGTTEGGTMHQHGGKGMPLYRVGKKAAGRLLDGVEHNGMPA